MASTHHQLTSTPVNLVSDLSLEPGQSYGAQFLGLGFALVTESATQPEGDSLNASVWLAEEWLTLRPGDSDGIWVWVDGFGNSSGRIIVHNAIV